MIVPFYDARNVCTVSLNRRGVFPEEYSTPQSVTCTGMNAGKGYNVCVPLGGGIDDTHYEYVFQPIINKVFARFDPNVVVLQCGADGLAGDKIGDWNLTPDVFAKFVRQVKGYNVPILLLGGGGYTVSSFAINAVHVIGAAIRQSFELKLTQSANLDSFRRTNYHLVVHPHSNIKMQDTRQQLSILRGKIMQQIHEQMEIRPNSPHLHQPLHPMPPDSAISHSEFADNNPDINMDESNHYSNDEKKNDNSIEYPVFKYVEHCILDETTQHTLQKKNAKIGKEMSCNGGFDNDQKAVHGGQSICEMNGCRIGTCPNGIASIECNDSICGSENDCENRQYAETCTKDTISVAINSVNPNKGYSAFLRQPKSLGCAIGVYAGKVMLKQTTDTNLYCMDATRIYGSSAVINAQRYGNNTRFISHSPHPNCIVRPLSVKENNGWKCTMMIYVNEENMSVGTELTINYHSHDKVHGKCHCNSSNCTGWVGGDAALAKKQKKEAIESGDVLPEFKF